jgi:hypothetical protein
MSLCRHRLLVASGRSSSPRSAAATAHIGEASSTFAAGCRLSKTVPARSAQEGVPARQVLEAWARAWRHGGPRFKT